MRRSAMQIPRGEWLIIGLALGAGGACVGILVLLQRPWGPALVAGSGLAAPDALAESPRGRAGRTGHAGDLLHRPPWRDPGHDRDGGFLPSLAAANDPAVRGGLSVFAAIALIGDIDLALGMLGPFDAAVAAIPPVAHRTRPGRMASAQVRVHAHNFGCGRWPGPGCWVLSCW